METKFEDQKEFIDFAISFYHQKTYYDEWFTGKREDVIRWLYKLGRDYNVLDLDYAQFTLILASDRRYCYDGTRYYYQSRWCAWKVGLGEYRTPRGFRYNGQPKKDNPFKNDWWEHKGLVRDRRKTHWRSGWKKNLKHFCKRKHRQLEREAIKQERYYKLHQWSYKQAEDPWSWD